MQRIAVHESELPQENYPDRWSKDLIGGEAVPTDAGFSLGVAEYFAPEFGGLQVHDDQEEVFIVSGLGRIRIAAAEHDAEPGRSFLLAPGTKHATRRTVEEPVRVVYTHSRPTGEPSMGVSESDSSEFGELRSHDDQEALYVLTGEGQVRVGDRVIDVRPGTAVYVPPNTPHARRGTGNAPLRTLYAHGAVS
jgi:mannose-6-phosphate isomerase-like protein (cupin superfamily)